MDKKSSCGLLNAVFGRRGFWMRRTASSASLPTIDPINDLAKVVSSCSSRRRRGGSDQPLFIHVPEESKPANRVGPNQQSQQRTMHSNQQKGVPMSKQNAGCKVAPPPNKVAATGNGYVEQGRKVPKEAIGISGELELMINDHQKSKGINGSLLRASSSNFMLFGNLGNLITTLTCFLIKVGFLEEKKNRLLSSGNLNNFYIYIGDSSYNKNDYKSLCKVMNALQRQPFTINSKD